MRYTRERGPVAGPSGLSARRESVIDRDFGRLARPVAVLALAALGLGCSPSGSGEVQGMQFSTGFEGGAAEGLAADGDGNVHFRLPAGPGAKERLWFYFRVDSPEPIRPWFILDNEDDAHQAYWDDVRPVVSTDGINWVRTEEAGHERSLLDRVRRRPAVYRFRPPAAARTFWVAYFYPYGSRELDRFLAGLGPGAPITRSVLGTSEEGRPIVRLDIAPTGPARQNIWIIAREHPGETPSSFVLEGVLKGLLASPAGASLRQHYGIRIVPLFNVDGAADGYYYRNSQGVDIAQDWGSFRSAEVRALHGAMQPELEAGQVALVFNLHSANAPQSHFLLETPGERLPDDLRDLQARLLRAANGAHPQLQVTETVKLWDYPVIAGNYLAAHHDVYCLYSESNYSVGADGTQSTPRSLRDLGEAFVGVLDRVLVQGR